MSGTTIAELLAAYRGGTVSVVGVLADLLTRLTERGDDGVWIDRVPDHELLDAAAALDGLLAADPAATTDLALFGVPFAVKGNIDVAGLPTTAGCPGFAYRPAADAAAVRRLRAAGALVVGTTNLDQFATGLVGTRSPYGIPLNAVRSDLVPGGSSSGSAVAVAAGLVPFALGTDTAGSGRVPAALNAVVGLKPTRGLVSTAGVVPACRTLDCVSVFATTADDARLVLDVIAGHEPDDAWSRRAPRRRAVPVALADLRVGWPDLDELDFAGDEAMRSAHLRTRDLVAARCASVSTVPLAPLLEAGALLYQGPWVAERLAALEQALTDCGDDVLAVTRSIIEGGAAYSAVDAFRARYRLVELAAQVERWWADIDVLLLPTVPTTFTVAEVLREPLLHNATLGRWTQFTNLLDLAGIALPTGLTDDGRPAGSSLYGPAFADELLLGVAGELLGEPRRDAVRRSGGTTAARTVTVAVAGRHLTGESRNGELLELGARLQETTCTAADYRLLALPPQEDPLPALVRSGDGGDGGGDGGGGKVEVELWALPSERLADLLAGVPAPLALGRITLADGREVAGFVGEAAAAFHPQAVDVTDTGGWRHRPKSDNPPPNPLIKEEE